MAGMPWNPAPGSMSGMNVANPAATKGDDQATAMMMELSKEYAQPGTPPQQASPIQNFLSLLAANAGAQLLQQPNAALPAQRAVEDDMGKGERFRMESENRLEKSRKLRLESMIRYADNQARQLEQEGKWQQAIKLQENAQEWDRELEGLRQKGRLAEIDARGREDRKTAAVEAAGRKEVAQIRASGVASAFGLTREQAKELGDYNDSLDRLLGGGYVGSVTAGGGVFDPLEAAAIANQIDMALRAKAAEIKRRDTPVTPGATHGPAPAVGGPGSTSPGAARYLQFYTPKGK